MEMVPKGFEFKTNPWTHQIAAFLASTSNDGFLSALDLGTGKTKVAIDTVRYFDGYKKKIKVLFVCLNSAVEKMKDEVEIHSNLSAVCVRGNKDEKWNIFHSRSNFYVINYEGLRSLITVKVKKNDEGKNKEVIHPQLLKRLMKIPFDFLILDESHTVKSPKSLIFRIIKKISNNFNNRLLLTGTPFGNTLLDVWSQYFVIDYGETFGSSFSRFRDAYFEDKGFWGPVWVPTKTGEKFVKNKLYSKALRYTEEECSDLPEKIFHTLTYSLSEEQKAVYNELIEGKSSDLTAEISNKAIAFRTISSGFIKSSDHIFKKNPKLDLLWETIEDVYKEQKVVIFVEYTMSRKIIENFLKKKKVEFASLSGETKDKYAEWHGKFQMNPKCRILVAQIKSGGASIDLTAGTYCIYYETSHSLITHQQSHKRIHRGGQTRRCFFYYLVGKGTVEVGMYKNLAKMKDAFDGIVDAKKFLIGEE